jgi:hypothetical protein
MASGGYDIGASFSSSSPSASGLNSPLYNQGGGGGLQIFAGGKNSDVNQPINPKLILYAGIAVVTLGALALIYFLFKK